MCVFPRPMPTPGPAVSLWADVLTVGRMLENAGGLFAKPGQHVTELATAAHMSGWHTDDAESLILALGTVQRALETLLGSVQAAQVRVSDIDALGFSTLEQARDAVREYGAGSISAAQVAAYERLTGEKIPSDNL